MYDAKFIKKKHMKCSSRKWDKNVKLPQNVE